MTRKKYKAQTLKYKINCHNCGTEFLAKLNTAKWCSEKCKADQNHRPHAKVYQLTARLKRYNLTREGFDDLHQRANGACQICGTETARLAIDHDHRTGEVRGLLCTSCNTGIGLLGDDVGRLHKAIEYLASANRSFARDRKGGVK